MFSFMSMEFYLEGDVVMCSFQLNFETILGFEYLALDAIDVSSFALTMTSVETVVVETAVTLNVDIIVDIEWNDSLLDVNSDYYQEQYEKAQADFASFGAFKIVSLVFELQADGSIMCLTVFEFQTALSVESLTEKVVATVPGAVVTETVLAVFAKSFTMTTTVVWNAELLTVGSALYVQEYDAFLLQFSGFKFTVISFAFVEVDGFASVEAVFEFQSAFSSADLDAALELEFGITVVEVEFNFFALDLSFNLDITWDSALLDLESSLFAEQQAIALARLSSYEFKIIKFEFI